MTPPLSGVAQTRLAAVLRGLIVAFTIGLTVHGAGVLVGVLGG